MKKLTSLLLVLVLLLSLCACGGKQDTNAPAPEHEETFVTNTLVKDGVCNYTIVYENTKEALTLAGQVLRTLSGNFGVTVTMAKASDKTAADYEIVVGKARPSADKVAEQLRSELDFAMKVEEKSLILVAADTASYQYFTEYLNVIFAKTDDGQLVMDSDDNFVYSQTIPVDKNYIAYMRENGKNIKWQELFAFKEFKNADTTLPYRIYVPFNHSPDKKLPVLLNLHGAGLRGNDNTKHLSLLDTMLLQEDQQLADAIIICPQCPEGQQWVDTPWANGSYSVDHVSESNEIKAVMELLQQVMQEYSVDKNRVYVSGYSMGGFATWDLLMRHGDVFAAGVAMCGAGDPSKAEQLKDMPIWAIHGGKDPTVPVKGSQDMAQALESAAAADFHYTELPNNEHDVWNYTYQNAEIFTWLFSQKKA